MDTWRVITSVLLVRVRTEFGLMLSKVLAKQRKTSVSSDFI